MSTRPLEAALSVAAAKEKILAQVCGNFDAFLADRKPGQPFCYWLLQVLTEAKNPRVLGDGHAFDRPPYTDVPADPRVNRAAKAARQRG
jgi:hypothetical protein